MFAGDSYWAEQRSVVTPSSRVPFYALCAFTFVLLIAPQARWPVLGQLRIAALAVGVSVLGLLIDRSSRGVPLFAGPKGAWPAAALALWAVGTVPLSIWPGGSLELFSQELSKSLVLFWLIPRVVDSRSRLRRLFVWLAILSVPLCLTALANYWSGAFLNGARGVPRIEGYDAPLTANPNDMALMLNLLLPLSYALWFIYKAPLARIGLAGLMLLQAGAIVVTYSRAGFVTLGVVWVFHAIRTLRGPQRIAAALGVVAVLGALMWLPSGYASHLGTLTNIKADPTGSGQARWGEMIAALGVIFQHPIAGVGLGQNVLAITLETGGWRMVHNVYLQYAADLGLLGLVLFLLILWRAIRYARGAANSRLPGSNELRVLARGVELSLWAFTLSALFHPAGYQFYIWYIGGLAFAVRAAQEREIDA